ncbi:hypothetical protein ACFHWD_03820 [Clostridium sp. MT-14]|jgi:hypothetical protein
MTNKEIRDNYYSKLMKKYNEYDLYILVEKLTNKENEIREKLELNCL